MVSYYMGGCQNYGPSLGTLNIRCRITVRTQKGTLILTTTHIVYPKTLLATGANMVVVLVPYTLGTFWSEFGALLGLGRFGLRAYWGLGFRALGFRD